MMHIENRILPYGPNFLGTIERNSETYITIHESSDGTGFATPDRTIEYYENRLKNPPEGVNSKIGYHFMVDGDRLVQFIPLKYWTAHAGSTEGNHSIAIERLVNCNVDFPSAIANQAKLAATLMTMFGIPLDHVVPHKYWSGKACPSRLLAGMYGGWDGFIAQVKKFYTDHDIFNVEEITFDLPRE